MLLLGTHVHPAQGDAARRQDAAVAALRGLTGVSLVNLQWPDAVIEVPGWRTLPALAADSPGVTGRRGGRKPIVLELFGRLAAEAERAGASHFAFTNSDIHLSQALVDRVLAERRDGYAVSRMDFDGETGEDLEVVTSGVDAFAVSVEWWRANAHRFRGYIVGEPVWDNVYASALLCHADAAILNRGAWARHERHPVAWKASPFAEYTRLLAALDRPYFSLWAAYWHRLAEMRERGATEAEEDALRRDVFRPPAGGRALHVARVAKARVRYALARVTGR
jgi:hypothetical protein